MCLMFSLTFYFLRGYNEQLQVYDQLCTSMLSEINSALLCLDEIAKRHSFVSAKTGALHQACEKLTEDQVWLVLGLVFNHVSIQ